MARGVTTTWISSEPALQAYLLGMVPFEAALTLQRRLLYEVAAEDGPPAIILCEHSPLITVGRQGSRAHLRFEPNDPQRAPWDVRWVNRGGGCLIHVPGQLAIYPILPLHRLRLGVLEYAARLSGAIAAVLGDFSLRHQVRASASGVWVGDRPVALLGLAVRSWITYYGAYLNIHPYLEPFRLLSVTGGGSEPMTSLERERHGPVRPGMVRQRLLEHFAASFGFSRTTTFSDHPCLAAAPQRCQRQPSGVG
jgi:lipoyl(octanoyl) transferase